MGNLAAQLLVSKSTGSPDKFLPYNYVLLNRASLHEQDLILVYLTSLITLLFHPYIIKMKKRV